jgi:hypothetical protein
LTLPGTFAALSVDERGEGGEVDEKVAVECVSRVAMVGVALPL